MQIVLLVIGLVLVIALPTLFTGAAAVGWICLAVFALITVIQLAALLFVGAAVRGPSRSRSFNNNNYRKRY